MKRIYDYLDNLPDPDNVGASEYRLVHEHLKDTLSNMEYDRAWTEREAVDHLIGSLTELIENATSVIRDLERLKNGEHPSSDNRPVTVRRLLVAEMEVGSASTADIEFEARLDAFRESVLPGSQYDITLYQATAKDITEFKKRGLLEPEPGLLIVEES